ncbi:MAG: hypothetical protein Q7S40_21040 [Opitutaceae bacterium]|nr:hypothetical protein [Opitutaceae bacterium]
MKRFTPLILIAVVVVLVIAPLAWAASATAARTSSANRHPGAPVATAVSTITGIAISPLLGTAGYGAYQWFQAKDDAARAKLPWYAQAKFWLPALLIVGICAAKDSFGATVPPGWKKPLDVLETLENKLSGLVAAGAVIPFAIDTMAKLLIEHDSASLDGGFATTGLATIPFGAMDLSWLINLLTVPFGVAIFVLVWLASHAINVLILLSPWGAIDAALKVGRTALLGLITAAATTDPRWGALFSIIVIIVAYFVAGWAFRLTIFGSVFCWDFLTRRRRRFSPAPDRNRMFAGANFTGVPVRTYGHLVRRADGQLEFAYQPWLFLPERVAAVPVENASLAVGKGLFFSNVIAADGRTLFLLPPRYRGHEDEVIRAYALGGGIRDAGLRKVWGALREMVGGRATKPPAPQLAPA